MENFNRARIHWEEHMMGHKKSIFLECKKEKFLVQALSS